MSGPESKEYQIEDISIRVHSQMQEVERRLMRGCTKQGMTVDTRRVCVHLLQDAAKQMEKFPLMTGEVDNG